MSNNINSIAVLGSGTMGAGIAALCLEKGFKVLLLDISDEAVVKGKNLILDEKYKMLSDKNFISNLEIGVFSKDFSKISQYDWICEAVVEDIDIKKNIFNKIEEHRKDGSIVSSNTSGIPLRDIVKGMPDRMLRDVCITHFFNPVKVMKLCELIPGNQTSEKVKKTLKMFLGDTLGKGVVNGKDTVNFIGNRIGCFFMLKGLYEGRVARNNNITIEKMDALLSKPVGLPPTGLYGLIDLIGLDVMYSVGKNLEINLPKEDLGRKYVSLPKEEKKLYENGQLGRKTGGGFYRIKKQDDGQKIKEVYDLEKEIWLPSKKETINENLDLMLKSTIEGTYIWNVMGQTLLYAADLIPEIADDIVNIDNAMKWGFAWNKGPFEMLDELGPLKVIEKCNNHNIRIPKMLQTLKDSSKSHFYSSEQEFLNLNGEYEKI